MVDYATTTLSNVTRINNSGSASVLPNDSTGNKFHQLTLLDANYDAGHGGGASGK